MEGETVSPRQFYGLELNPRAVPIADAIRQLKRVSTDSDIVQTGRDIGVSFGD